MSQHEDCTDSKVTDSPTAWFAVLDRARAEGDFALAERAQRELERLGVRVKFGRQRKRKGGER